MGVSRPNLLPSWSPGMVRAGETATRDGFVFADLRPAGAER